MKRPFSLPKTSQSGFSLAEVMVALGVSVVLGGIVFAIVATTVTISASTETRAATQTALTSKLTDITAVIDTSETVDTATRNVLIVESRTLNRCYRHEYRFAPDIANQGKLELSYLRSGVGIDPTSDCSLVKDQLDAGTGTYEFVGVVNNLHPESRFTYFDLTGQRSHRPGEDMYAPSAAVHACFLGRVEISLVKSMETSRGSQNLTNTGTALFAGNAKGSGQCR